MTDFLSKETRSRVMSHIRAKNTTPERYIAALLKAAGIPFFRHQKQFIGCPDFVFPKSRLIVFIDGDFWHGWRLPIWAHKLDPDWREKILANRKRDQRAHRSLRRKGWKVLRIWEHDIESDVIEATKRIADASGTLQVDWEKVQTRLARLPGLRRRDRLPRP